VIFKIPSYLIILFLLACTNGKNFQPAKITLDRDTCAHCHMIISDERFAAQLIDDHFNVYKFDDFGCALDWAKNNPNIKIEKYYVRNFEKKEWLDAKTSYWIKGRASTPMNYGYIAVPTPTKESITFKVLLKVYKTNRPSK